MFDYRHIQVTDLSGTAVIWFVDSSILDAQIVREIGDELLTFTEDARFHTVVFNFRGVHWVSFGFLAKLVLASNCFRRRGVSVKHVHLRPDIEKLFKPS